MGNRNETEPTRISLIGNKTKLSEEELAEIIDIHHEYPNMSSLKKYTQKSYRELSKNEKANLIKELLTSEPYIKYKNCWIAKTKLLYDTSETLAKETAALSRLSDLGYEVYLLPYAYARNNMNCYQKSADSITDGDFLEMKSVISTGKNAGYESFKDAHQQANNIYISFVNERNEKKGLQNIYRAIGGIKKNETKQKNDFSGYLFLNYEKLGKTNLYKISESGIIRKIEKAEINKLNKYKGIAFSDPQVEVDPMTKHGSLPKYKETVHDDFHVLENPMTEHGSSHTSNISQPLEKSTIQSVKLSNENGAKQLFGEIVKLKADNIRLEKEVEKLTKQLNQMKHKQKSKDDDFGRS